jgi:hypothetical protein
VLQRVTGAKESAELWFRIFYNSNSQWLQSWQSLLRLYSDRWWATILVASYVHSFYLFIDCLLLSAWSLNPEK